jgi:hypothetical protein
MTSVEYRDTLLARLQAAYDYHMAEPLDEITRKSVIKLMSELVQARCFFQWKVTCDDTNSPQSVFDDNDLVVDVMIQETPQGSVFCKTFNKDNSENARKFAALLADPDLVMWPVSCGDACERDDGLIELTVTFGMKYFENKDEQPPKT